MTQDERWDAHWREIMDFIKKNHRNPSKHFPEERNMHNWWKQQKKLFNANALSDDRIDRFNQLLAIGEQYRHINQYL